jgi:polysaccharide deacetylase family protein (PEP-CTERM system associated)
METKRLGELEIELLPPGEPACALTVDVEDWFHSNFRSAPEIDTQDLPRRVEDAVERLLIALDGARAKATFFVLGDVARDHPGIVPRIARAGHEIGCHSMEHTLVYRQPPGEFARLVRAAGELLRDQSGQPVWGFRAPSWSITTQSLWAFDRLAESGFRYDSSVFPAANYLYGVDGAPTMPYRVRTGTGQTLIELPPPIAEVGPLRLGVGGGLYLRALPLWVHRRVMRSYARRGAPFLAYIHPRDFDPDSWYLQLPLSTFEQIIHRFGIQTVPRKIQALLRQTVWRPLESVLAERDWLEPAGLTR